MRTKGRRDLGTKGRRDEETEGRRDELRDEGTKRLRDGDKTYVLVNLGDLVPLWQKKRNQE